MENFWMRYFMVQFGWTSYNKDVAPSTVVTSREAIYTNSIFAINVLAHICQNNDGSYITECVDFANSCNGDIDAVFNGLGMFLDNNTLGAYEVNSISVSGANCEELDGTAYTFVPWY